MKECNTILKNALILTMDKSYTQYQQGAVAINDGAIVAIGPEDTILKSWNGKDIINCQGKVLMPGLINTHTHVPMTL